jgi:hypothetical protein
METAAMLDQATLDAFARDGFVKGPKIVSDAHLDELRSELDRVIAQKGVAGVPQPGGIHDIGKEGHPLWQIVNIWLASDAFRRLLNLPGLGATAATMIGGGEIRLWHDQIQYKPKGVGSSNHWHQDWPYWPAMAAPNAVTAWIAIDDADVDNGCMRMVPGSHQWGKAIDWLHCIGDLDNMGTKKDYEGHPVEVRMCPVRAGEVHFHHSLTWHASHGNTSPRPRRAIALHLMNEQARIKPDGTVTPPNPNHARIWSEGRQIEVPPVGTPETAAV